MDGEVGDGDGRSIVFRDGAGDHLALNAESQKRSFAHSGNGELSFRRRKIHFKMFDVSERRIYPRRDKFATANPRWRTRLLASHLLAKKLPGQGSNLE